MQVVRNHIQVVARYNRSPPVLVPDYHNEAYRARNGDFITSQRIIQARYDAYYDMQRKAYNTILAFNEFIFTSNTDFLKTGKSSRGSPPEYFNVFSHLLH